MNTRPLATCIAVMGIGFSVAAGDVSGWRGDGTGRYPQTRGVDTLEKEQNVVWQTPLPGWSNASPVLTDGKVFICAEPDTLLCLDRQSGAILWQRSNSYADLAEDENKERVRRLMEEAERFEKAIRKLGHTLRKLNKQAKKNPEDEAIAKQLDELKEKRRELKRELKPLEVYSVPRTHGANGYSSPTPVTDGRRVFVLFATGVAAGYDLDGTRLWARVVEKPTAGWGHSSSPLLAGGRLILNIRSVHGLDPATGKTAWTAKSKPRWGTSVSTEINGVAVVITPNGELLRAKDGQVLASGLHALTYCAPLVHDEVVYFIEHGGKAFKLPSTADGSEKPKLLWQTRPPKDRYYASPLFHDGLIYCVNQKAMASVIDPNTGEVLNSRKIDALKRTVYTSVTLVGDRILMASEHGSTVLLPPGKDLQGGAVGQMGRYRTTPAFDSRRAYVRTLKTMYCIGE